MAKERSRSASAVRRPSTRSRQPISRFPSLEDRLGGKMPWVFAGTLALLILGVFRDYLLWNKTYLFKDIGSDTLNAFYPQLVYTATCISRGIVPGWSFNQGMGQNIFPNSLGEPFTWILYLLGPATLAHGIALVEILKLATAGFLFYWFLRLRNVGAFTATLTALCYAFCGTIIVGGGWYVFSTHAVHAALLLLACEMLIQRRRAWPFPVAVALITAFNAFYAYLFGIFLIVYLAARLLDPKRNDSWRISRLLSTIVGLGVIGLAIGAVFSFPSAIEMLQSPRIHGQASHAARLLDAPVFRPGDANYYASLVLRSFGNDLLGTGSEFRGWQNYLEAPMHYCGLLTLLLAPHVFLRRSGRQRWIYGIAAGAILAVQLLPWLRYSFWLFTGDYFRTLSLYFSIILLLYSARALEDILGGTRLNMALLLATLFVLLVLLYFPYLSPEQGAARVDGELQAEAAGFLVAYTTLLIALSRPSIRIHAQAGLLVVVAIELLLFANVSVGRRDVVTTAELGTKTGYNDDTKDALAIIRRQDTGFFRVEKSYFSSPAMHASLNDGKVQGYFGTSSYHSFNQLNYINFLAGLGVIDPKDETQTRWAPGLRQWPMLQTFASVGYWLVRGDFTREPFLVNGYTLIGKTGDLSILKNNRFVPLGFGVGAYVRESVHRALDPTQKDASLFKAFVIPDDATGEYPQFSEWQPPAAPAPYGLDSLSADTRRCASNALTGLTVGHNRIAGKFQNPRRQMLVFSIPFDTGWEATVDGQVVPLKKIDYGLTGLALDSGVHAVLLRYRPPMRTTGLFVSLLGLAALAGTGIVSRVSRRSGQTTGA